jgi:starvation-inducible DNA-binding protein
MTATIPEINVGIATEQRLEIAESLSRLLAETYTVYLKTPNFHWNITGPMFQTLHVMFEAQYNELALAVDLIAERIRALGEPAPGSYRDFARLSGIPDAEGVPNATLMLRELLMGHETVARTARQAFALAGGAPTTNPLRICSRSACSGTRRRRGCCGVCWSSASLTSATALHAFVRLA